MEALVKISRAFTPFVPNLQDVCSGWIGFTKKEAVHAVIKRRLLRDYPIGHGNKAARREAYLSLPKDEMTPAELDSMLEKMNRQYWADRQAEMKTEGRIRA